MSSAPPLFFCKSSARSIASKSMSVMQKVINGFLPIHDPSVIARARASRPTAYVNTREAKDRKVRGPEYLYNLKNPFAHPFAKFVLKKIFFYSVVAFVALNFVRTNRRTKDKRVGRREYIDDEKPVLSSVC